MEFLYEFGLFLLKAITIVAAILFVISGIVSASQKNKPGKGSKKPKGDITLTNLSEEYSDLARDLKQALLSEHQAKLQLKAEKKADKAKAKFDGKV